jgi:hypothetical protein
MSLEILLRASSLEISSKNREYDPAAERQPPEARRMWCGRPRQQPLMGITGGDARFTMQKQQRFMHFIEELLKEPDFIRSERLSAAILNSMRNDSKADRERLEQLLKALQFIASTTSPAAAPFLKLALESIELLSRNGISKDQPPGLRYRKRPYLTARRQESFIRRNSVRLN